MPGAEGDTAALIEALTHASEQIRRVRERAAGEYDVSPTLARMLSALHDDAPMAGELAGRLGLDRSSTSGLIGRAQLRGLVRRVPSQRDRRSVRVRLTGAGRELAAEIDSLVNEALVAMLEPLAGGERAALAGLLARLTAG